MNFVFTKWLIKYKLLHIIGWVAISFFLMFLYYDPTVHVLPQLLGTMVVTGLAFPGCYYAVYTLTPRYLYQKKIKTFISRILLLAFVNTIFTYLVAIFIYSILTGLPMFRSEMYILIVGYTMLWDNLFLITLFCAIKVISDRFFMEQQLLEIEKEKISTELNFLRSQVNPHFLFNVMNTIYFQIDKGNAQARSSVEKLSEMLRYQLYECITDKIDIGKEVEYIKNYVAMQSFRMEKETDIKLYFEDNLSGFFIAPLLLLPIIENAFKHISNFKNSQENKIFISLQKENTNTFSVKVTNTYDKSMDTKHLVNSGGLGMQNLKRRLDLLYPNKHLFNIDKQENLYETTIKIQYDD
jgi:two-component system LytT family sensor kinase